jgi:hypothetical protein
MTEPPEPRPPLAKPVQRRYGPPRAAREVDTTARLRLVGPFVIGFGAGFIWAPYLGIPWIILGPAVGALVTGIVHLFVNLAARTVSEGAFAASGTTTPHKREYSYAESLAVRGQYQEAIDAYEVLLSEMPGDPEPYLRIARLYRDRLGDADRALQWFKRARADARMERGLEMAVTQEVAEYLLHRSGDPRRAIPELARIVDRFPGTPAADWARAQMAQLRLRPTPTDL